MRPNRIVILLIVFISVFIGMLFVIRHKSSTQSERSIGIHIFSDLPVNRICEIDIKRNDLQVSLIRKKDIWIVKEHFGYLADFSQISELIKRLKDAITGQSFKADKETQKRLMLVDPDDPEAKEDDKGIALIFKDSKGEIIKKIIFGKGMRRGNKGSFPLGQYVRFSGDNNVYLIDQYITSLLQTPGEWIRLNIANVKPMDIKEIRGYKGENKPIYIISKENQQKGFRLKKGLKKIDKNMIKRIKDALSYLKIEDVVDPSKDATLFGISDNSYIDYELFNGMIYRIYPSKKCDKGTCYMKISFFYNGNDKRLIKRTEKLNQMFSPWVYKVSKWRHESFFLP